MTNAPSSGSAGGGLTFLGKFISFLLVLGIVGLGAWIVMKRSAPGPRAHDNGQPAGAPAVKFDTSELIEPKTNVRRLSAPQAYLPKDNVIDIELSTYAGYAGLIAANGGLEPSNDSFFAKKYGFTVRIKLNEDESWDALNSGKMAASATTADVLAVYGRQFQVVVPAQIGYSRGADGLVVRNDIRRVNDLKGKVVASSQFTESDFFIRYLAKEAGIPIKMLPDLNAAPDPESLNIVYCDTGEKTADLFVKALKADSKALAGCVTWAPMTTQIPADSGGKAKLLVSNKNLLIVADILIVNKGFADKNPDKVEALVDGLLAGNKAVRENPEANADIIGKAFKWDRAKTLAELQKVHLSNLPEQLAFFSGGITQGGSFASIYQSAILAYGDDMVPNPVDSDYFVSLGALKKADAAGTYKDQVAAIVPLAATQTGLAEVDPVLSKDIRFLFLANEDALDMKNADNLKNLAAIKRILDVAPGSHIVIVGHVDPSNIPEFRKQGGEQLVQQMALVAMDLSKRRAAEVKKQLIAHEKVDEKRLETVGKGWTQPVSTTNRDLNRRVEVQWFTLE